LHLIASLIRYTVLWPSATPLGAAAWPGWTLALRRLSTALRGVDERAAGQHASSQHASSQHAYSQRAAGPHAARTDALLEPLQLHCYGVAIGGHSSFWPFFNDAAALLAVRSRLAALRRALLMTSSGAFPHQVRSRLAALRRALWASFELHARAEAAAAADEPPRLLFIERKSRVRAIVNMGALRAALDGL
jgi:hypothetical protein